MCAMSLTRKKVSPDAMTTRYGVCSVCERRLRLTKYGRLISHRTDGTGCLGSGQPTIRQDDLSAPGSVEQSTWDRLSPVAKDAVDTAVHEANAAWQDYADALDYDPDWAERSDQRLDDLTALYHLPPHWWADGS